MTKEEAYEKLELPVGTNPHIVRQKFQQMHNEFQVQIDGAFREDMRQKLQTRLMELEEARKLLLGSEKADDSGSLPHTEKTFEQKRTEEAKAHTTQLTIQQALALFGLTEHQDVDQIEQHIASHIANLEQHLSTAPLQTAKELYQKEIDKATSAKKVINKWLDKRKKEKSQREEPQQQEPTQQEQAAPTYTPTPAKQKSKTGQFIGIAAAVIVVLAGFYFLSDRNGNPGSPTATTNLRQDSTLWKTTLVGNSEEAYQLYLDEYPEGIFAQVANDSLARLNERATAKAAELAKTEEQQAERDVAQKPVEQQAPNQVPTPATIRKEEANPKVDVNWKANYDKVTRADFSYDFFVIKNGKEGYVSKDGKVIIPPIYDELTWKVSRRESRIVGVKDGKEGLIDYSSGKELTSFIYSDIGIFQDGLADFKLSGTDKGYIDVNGKEVIPPIYTNAGSFAGGFAYVTNKAYQYGVIDKKGNIVVPFGKYKTIEPLRYSIDNYPVPKRFIAQLPDGEWILINEKDEFLRKTDENFLEPGMASYR